MLSDFHNWKEETERKTCSSYVKYRGLVKRPNGDILMYFNCNRSGFCKLAGGKESSRVLSKCPSNLRVKVTESAHKIIVKYFTNHNHSLVIDKMRLPPSIRSSIASK